MSSPPSSSRPAHSSFRWVICGLLFWVTTANYIDRSVFGNLAPEMPGRLHVNQADWDVAYWNMQMVFSAAYAISMLVMGRLMDVLGLRWGFVFACAFWGLASMSHAFAPQIGTLFGGTIAGFYVCRILLGLGEGGNFPAAIKTIAEWFPKSERALATGLFNSGTNIGGLLVPWLLPLVLAINIGGVALGWRGAFLITAAIDACWIVAWLCVYRKPEDHPRVSREELAHIQGEVPDPTVKIPWRRLLQHRQTWAFAAAKGMTDCFWWFYLFGTPDFFNKRFALDPAGRKYMIMMIYVLSSLGSIAGGWLAGSLMRRGWTTNKARKITMLICATFVLPVVYSAITMDKWVAAILITIAASAHQAWSANAFSLAGDMFPKRVVGSVTGLGGMIGASGGIVLFYITGKVLKQTGNYFPVFAMASVTYLVSLLIIHLLVPRLEPAKIDVPQPA
jgi:MFS transporter, ACS family, hexuronate transporter